MKKKIALALAGVMAASAVAVAPMNLFAASTQSATGQIEFGYSGGELMPAAAIRAQVENAINAGQVQRTHWLNNGRGIDLVIRFLGNTSDRDGYFEVNVDHAVWDFESITRFDSVDTTYIDYMTSYKDVWQDTPVSGASYAVDLAGNAQTTNFNPQANPWFRFGVADNSSSSGRRGAAQVTSPSRDQAYAFKLQGNFSRANYAVTGQYFTTDGFLTAWTDEAKYKSYSEMMSLVSTGPLASSQHFVDMWLRNALVSQLLTGITTAGKLGTVAADAYLGAGSYGTVGDFYQADVLYALFGDANAAARFGVTYPTSQAQANTMAHDQFIAFYTSLDPTFNSAVLEQIWKVLTAQDFPNGERVNARYPVNVGEYNRFVQTFVNDLVGSAGYALGATRIVAQANTFGDTRTQIAQTINTDPGVVAYVNNWRYTAAGTRNILAGGPVVMAAGALATPSTTLPSALMTLQDIYPFAENGSMGNGTVGGISAYTEDLTGSSNPVPAVVPTPGGPAIASTGAGVTGQYYTLTAALGTSGVSGEPNAPYAESDLSKIRTVAGLWTINVAASSNYSTGTAGYRTTYAGSKAIEYEVVNISGGKLTVHWQLLEGQSIRANDIIVIPFVIRASDTEAITYSITGTTNSSVSNTTAQPLTTGTGSQFIVSTTAVTSGNYEIPLNPVRIAESKPSMFLDSRLKAITLTAPAGYYFSNSNAEIVATTDSSSRDVTFGNSWQVTQDFTKSQVIVYRWKIVNDTGQPYEVIRIEGLSYKPSAVYPATPTAGYFEVKNLILAPYRSDEAPYGVDLNVGVALSNNAWGDNNSNISASGISDSYLVTNNRRSAVSRVVPNGSLNNAVVTTVGSESSNAGLKYYDNLGVTATSLVMAKRVSWDVAPAGSSATVPAGLVLQKAGALTLSNENLAYDIFAGRAVNITLVGEDDEPLTNKVKFSKINLWSANKSVEGLNGTEAESKAFDFNTVRSKTTIDETPIHYNGSDSVDIWGARNNTVGGNTGRIDMRFYLSADANFTGKVYAKISHGGAVVTGGDKVQIAEVVPNAIVKVTGLAAGLGNDTVAVKEIEITERAPAVWKLGSEIDIAVAEYGNAYPSNRAYFSAIEGRLEDNIFVANADKSTLVIANKRIANDTDSASAVGATGRGIVMFTISRTSTYSTTESKPDAAIVKVTNAIVATLNGLSLGNLNIVVGGTALVDNFAIQSGYNEKDLRYDYFDSWGYVVQGTKINNGLGDTNTLQLKFAKANGGQTEIEEVFVNGADEPTTFLDEDLKSNFKFVILDGRTLAPMKGIARALNVAAPEWNNTLKTATFVIGDRIVTFTEDSSVYSVQDSRGEVIRELSNPDGSLYAPVNINGRFYVPVAALCEALGVSINYDNKSSDEFNIITINAER